MSLKKWKSGLAGELGKLFVGSQAGSKGEMGVSGQGGKIYAREHVLNKPTTSLHQDWEWGRLGNLFLSKIFVITSKKIFFPTFWNFREPHAYLIQLFHSMKYSEQAFILTFILSYHRYLSLIRPSKVCNNNNNKVPFLSYIRI